MAGKKIGILALQGAFREHKECLQALDYEALEVRLPKDLSFIDALIIPGGESTTIGKLATDYQLLEPLQDFAKSKPVWGTCAGMIFLAKDVGRKQPTLQLMDIVVERNAFGRQKDSFITNINCQALANSEIPFPAVFIRAPIIKSISKGIEILATLGSSQIIAARQQNLLATSFHPELTDDLRFHKLFLSFL